MSKNKFDYIIVGSGIEALLKGLELERQGLKGCLIEKEESLGGLFRGLRNNDVLFESHLQYLPETAPTARALEALQNEIPEMTFQTTDVGPLTFQNGQVQPFMGFGQTDNEAVDLYSQFTQSSQFVLSQNICQLIGPLREKYTGEILNLSEVTALELSPEVLVTLNGTTILKCETLYFFESPLRLSKLLLMSKTALPKTLIPKLSKTTLWTSVLLAYQHEQPLTDSKAIHILYGSKEQPCVGRFGMENGVPTSQWLCLVGPETAADSEGLGGTIREMKKQIKRMYPHFFETSEKENILVSPESYGLVNPQLLENDHFQKLPNLRLGSRYYTNGIGLWGDLLSLFLATPETAAQPTSDLAELT